MTDAGREPARLCTSRDQQLMAGLVDGEGAADCDRGTAGGNERFEGGVHVVLVDAARRVDEGVLGLERVSGSEPDRPDPCSLARGAKVGLRADPEDSDTADVALEQRVHRLGRRERYECDAAVVLTELARRSRRASTTPVLRPSASCEVGTTA